MDSEIKEAEYKIQLAQALDRLINNSMDFRLLIMEGYLQKYPLGLLYQKANSNNEEGLQRKLDSVSLFNQFLEEIKLNGEIALRDLTAYKEDSND